MDIKDIKKGDKIKKGDIIFKRPGLGIRPSEVNKVLNKKAKRNILKDKWLTKDMN